MYVMYGTFQFDPGECSMARFEVEHTYSRRGSRAFTTNRAHLRGSLLGCTEAEVQSRIDAFLAAFSVNNQELALYRTDGVKTNHVLFADGPGMLRGPRVMYRVWPEGGVAEHVTKRDFQVIVENQTSNAGNDKLWWFEETVTLQGSGQPLIVAVETQTLPVLQPVWPQTVQFIIQEGRTVGMGGYYTPPPGLWPLASEIADRRISAPENPQPFGGHDGPFPPGSQGNAFYLYPWSYRYVFQDTGVWPGPFPHAW